VVEESLQGVGAGVGWKWDGSGMQGCG
jgi:hypothetical protein